MEKLRTETLDLGDIRIAYRQHGGGQALLLLHGNSESKRIFTRHQLVHFKDYHTFALDSRGHGESISEDESYSIAQYSDDVIHFCRAKGIKQACVVGYSDGGNIALFLALKAPGLFPRIAAISPNYLVSGTTEGSLKAFRLLSRLLHFMQRLGFKTRKAIMRIDLMLNDIGISAQELGTIRTSLRILYAENDLIKEDHILEMGSLVPGCTLCKIPRCNHMNILSKEEAIADILAYFAG